VGLLQAIEAAENGSLPEPPNCFVKTQFGTPEVLDSATVTTP